MCQEYYTRKRRKGKHLTQYERGKIEVFLKENRTIKYIADYIGVSERTIYREKKRGMVKGLLNSDLSTRDEYAAEYAQMKVNTIKNKKEHGLKIGKDHKLANFIETKIIKDKYSPEAVILEIKEKKLNFDTNICFKTIYNYIDKGIFLELERKNLPNGKKKNKKHKRTKTIRKKSGKSIEQRSPVVNLREEPWHWEMDTVVGKREGKSSCLLVLTERKTRKEIIRKIERKNIECVVKVIDDLEKQYPKTFRKRFKTITVDNGSEFMDDARIEISKLNGFLRTELFYAHSFCSYERGSNENANKLIRRHIPKGTDISKISNKKIKEIEKWMNNYPRGIFDGKSAEFQYKLELKKDGLRA